VVGIRHRTYPYGARPANWTANVVNKENQNLNAHGLVALSRPTPKCRSERHQGQPRAMAAEPPVTYESPDLLVTQTTTEKNLHSLFDVNSAVSLQEMGVITSGARGIGAADLQLYSLAQHRRMARIRPLSAPRRLSAKSLHFEEDFAPRRRGAEVMNQGRSLIVTSDVSIF